MEISSRIGPESETYLSVEIVTKNETESDDNVSRQLKGSPCFYAKFSIIYDA